MVIELRIVQFWSEIIRVISNVTRAVRSFDSTQFKHHKHPPTSLPGFSHLSAEKVRDPGNEVEESPVDLQTTLTML